MMIYGDISQLKLCPILHISDIQPQKKEVFGLIKNIYLSWQGNAEDTFEVLKDNGVDNINKLIETPGRGYRLQLFRHMMLEYHKTRPHKVKDFAAFTKLNNAKCVSIEPELTCGGVAAYAQKLLEEVSAPKEVE